MPIDIKKISLIVLFFAFSSRNLHADEFDTFQLNYDISKSHISNVFKSSSDAISDQSTMQVVGLKIDKPYALQRLKLDINYTDTSYQKNTALDFAAVNYTGELDWSITPNFKGVLSKSRKSNLAGFTDFRAQAQNIQTSENTVFNAEYSTRVLTYIAGITDSSNSNSRVFSEQRDSDSLAFNYGVKYASASGSTIALMGHSRDGRFKSRELNDALMLDNGFNEREFEVNVDLEADEKSKLYGKLSYLSQSYDHYSQRDYSVLQGYLNYDYRVSSKMVLHSELNRKASRFETSYSTYAVRESFNLGLSYAYSEKLNLNFSNRVANRAFMHPISNIDEHRSDLERTLTFGVTWHPQKFAALALSTTKSSRDSNYTGFDYNDLTTMVNLDFKI